MWGNNDPDLIADLQALSTKIATAAAWLAIGIATYVTARILDGIAYTAWQHLKHPSFWYATRPAFYAAFITTGLAGAPFIRFILVMWKTRFEEISNRLNDNALGAYLIQFWEKRFVDSTPGLRAHLATYRRCGKRLDTHYARQAEQLFRQIYTEQYGQLAFVTPVILVLAIIAIETVIMTFLITNDMPLLHHKFAYPAFGAAAGTYMFVVGDSVMAARRRSLNISDVYWYALRLVLAAPLGLAVYKIGGDMMGAFALGTLPIDQFRKVFSRYTGKNFTLLETQTQAPDQLIQLDGVTADISAQLGLEGITAIEQLVGSDPVSLAIRTGLPFKLVLCLGSQAIVRRHLRMNAGPLAGIGLAQAEPITRLLRDLQLRYALPPVSPRDDSTSPALWLQNDAVVKDKVILNALAYINDAATAQTAGPKTQMTVEALLTAFQRIADESYTKFLMANDGYAVCAVPGCDSEAPLCGHAKTATPAFRPFRSCIEAILSYLSEKRPSSSS